MWPTIDKNLDAPGRGPYRCNVLNLNSSRNIVPVHYKETTIKISGGGGLEFLPDHFIYFTREMESYILLPQDLLYFHHALCGGHLFISPIFPTKIFILKKPPPRILMHSGHLRWKKSQSVFYDITFFSLSGSLIKPMASHSLWFPRC